LLNTLRELLHRDPFILRASKRYPPEEPLLPGQDARFSILDEDVVQFCITATEFLPWLQLHQVNINTNFVHNQTYKYVDGSSERMTYYCQRGGKKKEHKNRVKGGLSGKPRSRKSDMKTGCRAAMYVTSVKKKLGSGLLDDAYCIEYRYRHNHTLGGLTDIGSRQKSAAIKATIRSLILQGSTIHRVMQQLTMDYGTMRSSLKPSVEMGSN